MIFSAFRIVLSDFGVPGLAFSGKGAKDQGGRWNFEGEPVVYCSKNLSLAVLEKRIQAGPEAKNLEFVLFEVQIPDGSMVTSVDFSDCPDNWRSSPPPNETKEIGSEWLENEQSPVLSVPSVVVPRERNLMLNPNHDSFDEIGRSRHEPFTFDSRLRD